MKTSTPQLNILIGVPPKLVPGYAQNHLNGQPLMVACRTAPCVRADWWAEAEYALAEPVLTTTVATAKVRTAAMRQSPLRVPIRLSVNCFSNTHTGLHSAAARTDCGRCGVCARLCLHTP